MRYQDYFEAFGGSYRSKHCKKRGLALPSTSRLPKEFVRLDPWEGEYLWSVAQEASVGVVEIGRRNGGSTFLLACATAAHITSIDKAPVDDELLRNILWSNRPDIRAENVSLIVADSRIPRSGPAWIDLLFIDGDHSYGGCNADLFAWSGRVVRGGSIVFHDSYEGSYGVRRAAEEFAELADIEVIKSPLIPAEHWTIPTGSIAHLRRL